MVTRLQMQSDDLSHILALNSHQESKEPPQEAEEAHDTAIQLSVKMAEFKARIPRNALATLQPTL